MFIADAKTNNRFSFVQTIKINFLEVESKEILSLSKIVSYSSTDFENPNVTYFLEKFLYLD